MHRAKREMSASACSCTRCIAGLIYLSGIILLDSCALYGSAENVLLSVGHIARFVFCSNRNTDVHTVMECAVERQLRASDVPLHTQ